MKKSLFLLLLCHILSLSLRASDPYCRLVTYDENDGLSQHLVKQIVEDKDGMMWFATWNGINRFDGYEFRALRPDVNDEVRRYSSRFRDIKLSSSGNLWCRIDDKIVSLDINDYSFGDVHSRMEKMFGKPFEVSRWWQTDVGELVIECADGSYIVIPEDNLDAARLTDKAPDSKILSPGNRAFGQIGPYVSLAYSRKDSNGAMWALTRDGLVVYAEAEGSSVRILADLKLGDGSARYCTTDREGNVWFVSSMGAHCLTLGHLPYSRVAGTEGATVVALAEDRSGRIWVADRTGECVMLLSPALDVIGYLGPDGKIHNEVTSFGHAVYSIYEASDGIVWLGSKPGGLFRLSSTQSGAYDIRKIIDGNVYDTLTDSRGRLWVATLGEGIKVIDNPNGDSPDAKELATLSSYPKEANACRRLLTLGDSLMLAATTGGLLVININDLSDITLHATVPGEPSSLGCIAVMDILSMPDGRLLIATESDAVNEMKVSDGRKIFSSLDIHPSIPSDVALSLSEDNEDILVISHNLVYKVDREGKAKVYGPSYWHGGTRFRESRSLRLNDGTRLFALEDGLIYSRLESSTSEKDALRPIFTSVSIENRPDSLLPASTASLTLDKSERNITLRFSALAHNGLDEIAYESRLDDGDWTRLGHDRSITLLDLEPGTFTIEIRAIDISGERDSDITSLELTVRPKFHETLAARLLLFILICIVAFLSVRLYLYVRRIKRKQKETLDAYMSLLAKSISSQSADSPDGGATAVAPTSSQDDIATDNAKITETDRLFMDKIVNYVNAHLSDPEAGVDGMAEATSVSRSGLSRKMRSLTGVSPADFLKQARLSHSATLLVSSDLSVKEIAWECGFADLNYFGKCFKAAYSMTPTAYRKANHQ